MTIKTQTQNDNTNLLRQLPAIEKLLSLPEIHELQDSYGRSLVIEALRSVVSDIRDQILGGEADLKLPEPSEYAELVLQQITEKTRPPLRTVVNATGTVTHTNLGRSLLSPSACKSLQKAAQNYVNLEYES